jgi:hypothetical protein
MFVIIIKKDYSEGVAAKLIKIREYTLLPEKWWAILESNQ